MKKQAEKLYPSVANATKDEHIGMVREIFGTITESYDFLNHLLSLRRDVAWRRFAVKRMCFFNTLRFLDVACGTGDLAIDVALRYPHTEISGLDFVREMMVHARQKIEKKGLGSRIRLIEGDAVALPFADNSFDVAAIAFGIRNIPDMLGTLREMTRVVTAGGQIMVLEMVLPPRRLFRYIYYFYLSRVLPRLAKVFTGNPGAYLYLADSIRNFPTPEKFVALMKEAGLTDVKKYSLTLGVTYLFSGTKKHVIAQEPDFANVSLVILPDDR
jgi:demethylmenaquinone methyltransferase/2-methoxy-6-polyprenyl-1,4-benzoquinol methylase